MSQLSLLAESLIGSEIVKLGNDINVRIRNGEEIFNYTIGDFDPNIFPIPQELEDGIVDAYRAHQTNYPAGDGILELRQGVQHYFKEWHELDYELDEIQISSGGRPLIYTLFRTLVDEDDKVIYAVPSWNNNHYVHMNWGRHCLIEAMPEDAFMPTAAAIAPHLEGATLLCLCTPQNPTGTTFSKKTLKEICDLVLEENNKRGEDEKKLYVMFDQMYCLLTYGETKHYNPVSLRPEMKEYTVFVDGISKSLAATGVRVGWTAGPAKIIGKIKAFLSHIGAWAPMAEQKATAAYLQDTAALQRYLEPFKNGLEKRLWLIYDGIMALKEKGYNVDAIAPQAAIYLTLKIDISGMHHGSNILQMQADVTQYLLSDAKLAIVPFSAFGAPSSSPWYRLSVGTCKLEDIERALINLEKALAALEVPSAELANLQAHN